MVFDSLWFILSLILFAACGHPCLPGMDMLLYLFYNQLASIAYAPEKPGIPAHTHISLQAMV